EPYTAIFSLLLFTGLRLSCVVGMEWAWVDWNNSRLIVPRDKMKNAKEFKLPLSSQSLAILKGIREKAGASPFVFPTSKSHSGHMENPISAFRRVLKRAKIENMRVHDLRHTAASFYLEQGASIPEVAGLLGHKWYRTSERYAHLKDDKL